MKHQPPSYVPGIDGQEYLFLLQALERESFSRLKVIWDKKSMS